MFPSLLFGIESRFLGIFEQLLHTEFNIFFASLLKQHKLLTTDAFMYSSGAFIDFTTVYVRNATLPAFKHAKFFFFFPARRNVHVPCSDCLFCIKNIAKDFLILFLRHALTSNSGLKLYSRALTFFCVP